METDKYHLNHVTVFIAPKMGKKNTSCFTSVCTEKNTSLLQYFAQNL